MALRLDLRWILFFGVEAQGLVLERTGEMYQWTESSHQNSKSVTEYRYFKDWSTAFIPTPKTMPENAQMVDGFIYLGEPNAPKIGDLRMSYKVAPAGLYSVVAGQKAQELVVFNNADLNNPLILMEAGTRSPEQMFELAHENNTIITWILRLIGFLAMFAGLFLVSQPLATFSDWVPVLGSVVGFVAGVASFVMAVAFSSITIAIAWLFYRPILAIVLLALGIGSIATVVVYLRKKSPSVVV